MNRRIFYLIPVSAALAIAVWAAVHFKWIRRNEPAQTTTGYSQSTNVYTWDQAIERVKADRGEPMGGGAAVETPPELKHYSERYWFLATQVAEVEKHRVQTCQDFLDLAAMIERGEMVAVPAVTNSYVLFGVGQRADQDLFTRYEQEQNVELYDEARLSEAYKRLEEKRTSLESEIGSLKTQSTRLTKREHAKRSELQKQISAQERELNSANEEKALLDQYYGQPDSRRQLFRDYQSLQTLAKNFGGRTYNLENPSDRYDLKVSMLRSLRPEALKVMEEVATAYQQQFDRPLPVSSLVRPEQYQRALRRVNRNAVLIDTPPHSTGLAFDIDYRYMSAAEQTFVMAQLARLKNEGRIEVIRERNANYHVFAFINGTRPNDELITASLEKAGAPAPEEAHHAEAKSGKQNVKSKKTKARPRPSGTRVKRKRRR
jgi:Family of unknown function (DUF5715)